MLVYEGLELAMLTAITKARFNVTLTAPACSWTFQGLTCTRNLEILIIICKLKTPYCVGLMVSTRELLCS